ncbi:hypothetical protein [Bacillus tianshenii]|uniref:hypothetical protein n=1 Tax=Sutcliffiella tianshenii TaxID=1463404 RepID=UPI00195D86E8|nr:hypothetical protein [Bacillus tianshenii]
MTDDSINNFMAIGFTVAICIFIGNVFNFIVNIINIVASLMAGGREYEYPDR